MTKTIIINVYSQDVETLRDKLPNMKAYRIMKNWNHVDFVYGKTARTVLYSDILKNMNSF